MAEQKLYTVILFTQNLPGVLYRIADLFLRRKINIESLTVSELEEKNMSRFTIVVRMDTQTIEKLVKQLYRIIEVIKVFEKTDDSLFFQNLTLIKVTAKTNKEREAIESIVRMSQASVGFIGKDYVVVQKAGTEQELRNVYMLLKPFGIKEYVHSGRVAVLKDADEVVPENNNKS